MNKIEERLSSLPAYDETLNELWKKERKAFKHKIIALDDDPTGVQTVHGIPVFTDWTEETIRNIFSDDRQLVFILTNSRAFSREKTAEVHQDIAERIAAVSEETGQPFLVISRGDSTLRGHYPLETETLKQALEQNSGSTYDGEIITPFFKEGGRLTIDDVHYVKQGNDYIPAGETEFAKDRTFGYKSSNIREYVEEKTEGEYPKETVLSVSLDELRAFDLASITAKLDQMEGFQKLVVNAIDEDDLKAFSIALLGSIKNGRHFLFRTAAAFTKVIGDISSKPLLGKEELVNQASNNGGLIVVGSHVQKTSAQLARLKELDSVEFVEFDVQTVTDSERFAEETQRVQDIIDTKIEAGTSVCVYTTRKRLDLGEGRGEEELALSVKISDAVTRFVNQCKPEPKYVIAKGGITSSDVGTKGLEVKKAEVIGQAAPGIPVWKTGPEARFPHIPYIIFPGNVGDEDTLLNVVRILE